MPSFAGDTSGSSSRASSRDLSRQQPQTIRRNSTGVRRSQLITGQPTREYLDANYRTIKSLGSGSFGTITLVQDKVSGEQRVCKTVHTAGMQRELLDMLRKEIAVLRTLDHPYIVTLYEFSEDFQKQQLTLILDYIDGGDAEQLIQKAAGVPLRGELVASLLHQLLRALAYCHARGIAHRDVKPENMMLTTPFWGSDPDCKVIDFGLAEFQRAPMIDFCGTPPYMAPEIVNGSSYTYQADIWSVGCTAMELLTGRPPFGSLQDNHNEMNELLGKIRKFRGFSDVERSFSNIPAWTCRHEEARSFVQICLCLQAIDRPTAKQAATQAWLDKHRKVYCCLTATMIESMTLYAQASPLVRSCLLILSSRISDFETQEFAPAFLGMDTDGDGLITVEELCTAVEAVPAPSGCVNNRISGQSMFKIMDADHDGKLSFTEFVAACLYSSYETLDEITYDAFHALDKDRDGLVMLPEVLPSFNQSSRVMLSRLPVGRPLNVDEWCTGLSDVAQDHSLGGSQFVPANSMFFNGCFSNPCALNSANTGMNGPAGSRAPAPAGYSHPHDIDQLHHWSFECCR